MGKNCSSDLPRAISVADYILEDGGHTLGEASEEFKLSVNTLKRDINYLGCVAFYEFRPNSEELKKNI